MRVLLVDHDDPDYAEVLQLLLEHEGHHVRVAASGSAAQRELIRFRPAAAIVDVGMGMNHACKLAWRMRRLARCGLIAVSDLPAPSDGLDPAFDYYLAKPLDFAALREVLSYFDSEHT
jgi:DNA-binding response OmpR family regulator